VALEEPFVHRHRFDGDDPLPRYKLLDPVDEEHGITVRKRRHDPLDVKRS
jgi:hypothetical protein